MMKFFEDGDRVQLYKGDCLEIMPQLEGAFDAIVSDLPFEITTCKEWDRIIPFEPLWECYRRLIKPNGAIVLFGSQPFTSALVMSNPKWFKYCWVWEKESGTNFGSAKYQPLKTHEDIAVFSKQGHCYYPQMREVGKIANGGHKKPRNTSLNFQTVYFRKERQSTDRYPSSILRFDAQGGECNNTNRVHPTQKPIDLLSYLIKTYTLPNERILDNTAGSFSTGVAAVLNGRKFVGIEREEKYCAIGQQRIEKALQEVDSMLIKPWELDEKPIEAHQQTSLFETA